MLDDSRDNKKHIKLGKLWMILDDNVVNNVCKDYEENDDATNQLLIFF